MIDKLSKHEIEKLESDWIIKPSAVICARLAETLRQTGKLDESREVADTGLRRWKNNTAITIVLGKCYRDSGLLEKAMESFAAIHQAQPQNLVALLNLAEIHFKKENWGKSVSFYEEYLFECPGDEEARDKLEEARSWKNSPDQIPSELEQDELEQDELEKSTDAFPKTERMNKVLESQGILNEAFSDSEEEEDDDDDDESDGYTPEEEEESSIAEVSPDSLIAFFSEQERKDLKLKPYDGEDE